MGSIKQFENLSTSYVNLAALLRYLREQKFSGSIHLAMDEYEAEIFLNGSASATVFEIDRESGNSSRDEGAMERVLVHAREAGGIITIYEGKVEPGSTSDLGGTASAGFCDQLPTTDTIPDEQIEWAELLRISGDVIAAIERAVTSVDADFHTNFRTACIALGDDYPFLDPTGGDFKYANGIVTLDVQTEERAGHPRSQPTASVYIKALSECLRRIVNKLAIDKEGKRFRERVAVELAVASRMRPLGDFQSQLDRIAGTRVL